MLLRELAIEDIVEIVGLLEAKLKAARLLPERVNDGRKTGAFETKPDVDQTQA